MRNAGVLLLFGAALLALSRGRSPSGSSSSGSGSGGAGGSGGGTGGAGGPVGGAGGPGTYPVATRTGYTGPDAWRVYAREVHGLAREYLASDGASVVEQEVGALLAAVIGQLETSGRAEYDYNVGNIRPIRDQARSRNPGNGVLFRAFPSRRDGVIAVVNLARKGARYRDAYNEAVRLASEGEPLEPLIGALVATLHDRGYDEAPQQWPVDSPRRVQWVQDRARLATRAADLVTRALNSAVALGAEQSQAATSQAAQESSAAVAQQIRGAIAPATPVDAGTVTRAVE